MEEYITLGLGLNSIKVLIIAKLFRFMISSLESRKEFLLLRIGRYSQISCLVRRDKKTS